MLGDAQTTLDQISTQVRQAVAASTARGVPQARAAWIKQQLMRANPGFDQRAYGYRTFGEFLQGLGEFEVGHDGFDITVALVSEENPPPLAQPSQAPKLKTRRSLPRVAQDLWKAFTRHEQAPPVYLDVEALSSGRLVVTTTYHDGLLEIPVNDQKTQAEWLRSWVRDHAPSQSAAVLATLETGGYRAALSELHRVLLHKPWSRERSERSIQRLEKWATDSGLRWAPPLIEPLVSRLEAKLEAKEDVSTATLREVAVAVVRLLDEQHLRQTLVPLGIVYDAMKGAKRE